VALALPTLALLLLMAIWAVGVAGAQMACADAARAGARAAARGESPAAVSAVVLATAPAQATVATDVGSGSVTVRVSARPPQARWLLLPGITVHASAVAPLETGIRPPGALR